MTKTELKIHSGLPGLNQMIDAAKRNRYAYAKMKKKWTQQIALELLGADCVPETPYERLYLDIVWQETAAHRRDPDNVRAGVKFILDAMVQIGIIEDDTSDHVCLTRDRYMIGDVRSVKLEWSAKHFVSRRAL